MCASKEAVFVCFGSMYFDGSKHLPSFLPYFCGLSKSMFVFCFSLSKSIKRIGLCLSQECVLLVGHHPVFHSSHSF